LDSYLAIKLPENFTAPLLQDEYHPVLAVLAYTLADWMRTYVFFPLSGFLIRTRLREYPVWIALIAQVVTMVLVGIWHGLTINSHYGACGMAIGLFLHKVYNDQKRRISWPLLEHPLQNNLSHSSVDRDIWVCHVGWVFFALPDFSSSVRMFQLLLI